MIWLFHMQPCDLFYCEDLSETLVCKNSSEQKAGTTKQLCQLYLVPAWWIDPICKKKKKVSMHTRAEEEEME